MTPNGPRLSVQQLEHAIQVYEKRVQAKKLEIHAYSQFREGAADYASLFSNEDTPEYTRIQETVVNLGTAKVEQGLLDLEELELQVKALKQARSGIVIPR
jgi:hypothetical protein